MYPSESPNNGMLTLPRSIMSPMNSPVGDHRPLEHLFQSPPEILPNNVPVTTEIASMPDGHHGRCGVPSEVAMKERKRVTKIAMHGLQAACTEVLTASGPSGYDVGLRHV